MAKSGWNMRNMIEAGLIALFGFGFAWVEGIADQLNDLEKYRDERVAADAVEKETTDKAHATADERDEADRKAEKERIDALFAAINAARRYTHGDAEHDNDRHDDAILQLIGDVGYLKGQVESCNESK